MEKRKEGRKESRHGGGVQYSLGVQQSSVWLLANLPRVPLALVRGAVCGDPWENLRGCCYDLGKGWVLVGEWEPGKEVSWFQKDHLGSHLPSGTDDPGGKSKGPAVLSMELLLTYVPEKGTPGLLFLLTPRLSSRDS